MMGKSLAEYNMTKSRESLATMLLLYRGCIILTALLWAQPVMDWSLRAVMPGILLALPAMALLSQFPRRKWDDFMGNASSGIFLSHTLIVNIFVYYLVRYPASPPQLPASFSARRYPVGRALPDGKMGAA